jgi:alpha-1,3-rhamnosyl/mannosyltransferase
VASADAAKGIEAKLALRVVLDARIVIPRMTGAGRYVIELAKRIPALTGEVALQVLFLPSMRATRIPAMLADAGVTIRYADVRVASLKQWFAMPGVLNQLHPDVYHYPFLDLPYVRFPSVVTIYDLNPVLNSGYFDHLGALKRTAARRLVKSTLRRSRAAIAISEATRSLIREHFPESAHKVRTIHLGVDSTSWHGDVVGGDGEARSSDNHQVEWRLRSYVLYVGVDRPHKNLVRLVRAFGRFRAMNDWLGRGSYLWLAGVGAGSPALRQEIADLALGQDVRLDPALSESALREAYRGATAVAYVSLSEGFGLPVLEAFAAGVPVLAADVPSLVEVGGDAVLYTSPYDEMAMAEALSRVWNDPSLRRALAERGLGRLSHFSWDAMATATVETYHQAWKVESTARR